MKYNILKKGEAWIMLLLSFVLFYLTAVTDHYWLIFVCFVPFLISLQQLAELKTRILAGFLFGLLYFGLASFWIHNVNGFIFCAAVLYQSCFMALFALGCHVLLRNAKEGEIFPYITIACLWVGIEYLRSLGYLGLPIGLAGYQLIPNLYLIQSASIFGIYGLSFYVLLINCLLFLLLQKGRSRTGRFSLLVSILVLIFGNLFYGQYVLGKDHVVQEQTAAIIQANIKPDRKWDVKFIERNIEQHEKLSRLALGEEPDLIIWPETAVACFLLHPARESLLKRIESFAADIQTPLLIGTQDIKVDANGKAAFNSAILISKEGNVVRKYDKMKLVPFVERAPANALIPVLRKVEGLMPIYVPGKRLTLFENKGTKFSTIICYEALFPRLIRKFVKGGAQWIVNITNDEPALGDKKFYYKVNADMTIIRAIENRRSIVRAANTGISMFIDPYGRVKERLPVNTEGYLSASIPINTETTLYHRFGDIIVFFSFGAVIIGIAKSWKTEGSD